MFHPGNEARSNERDDAQDALILLRKIAPENRFVMRNAVSKFQQRVELGDDARSFGARWKRL
jgi:hypothetical protein